MFDNQGTKNKVKELKKEYFLHFMVYKITILLAFIVIALIGLIIYMLPLKEKVPYLVQWSNAQMNFAQVEKIDRKITKKEFLRKNLLSAYVIFRESKTNTDDKIRKDIVRLQSSYETYKVFKKLYENKTSFYQKPFYTREVNVINVNLIPNSNIGQVDFQAILYDSGRKVKTENFRVVIDFSFDNLELKYEDGALNPNNFKVNVYNLSNIKF